jgi:hypothetical protein
MGSQWRLHRYSTDVRVSGWAPLRSRRESPMTHRKKKRACPKKGPLELDSSADGALACCCDASDGCDFTTSIQGDAISYRSGTNSRLHIALRGRLVRGPEWAAPQKTPVARGNSQQSNSVPVATVVGLVSGKVDRARIEANTGPKGLWPSQCNPREWWKRMAGRESPR